VPERTTSSPPRPRPPAAPSPPAPRRTPVTLNAGTDIVSTGDGADTVNGTLGGADVVNLEGDDDTFGYQDALAGDVRGGLGSDILLIEAADGVVSLNLNAAAGFGAYSGFENISGATADDSITVTASTAGGSITTGSAIDGHPQHRHRHRQHRQRRRHVTGTLDATDVVDLQGDNDSFDYQVLVGDVRGGSGSDSLVIDAADGAVTLDLNDTFGAGNYSDFENIAAATADDIITVIASTNGGSITTGSAADDITLNTGTDVVLAGTRQRHHQCHRRHAECHRQHRRRGWRHRHAGHYRRRHGDAWTSPR
jgi:hypothetical protein